MTRLNARDASARSARAVDDYSEALARGIAVLRAFGAGERLTLADLARRLELPRATVRRAVVTLAHLGYVEAEGRTFTLTPRVLELAGVFLRANPVSALVQPVCEEIAAELGDSCTAAVLQGDDAVMLARAVPHQLVAVGHGVGFRVPAARSALGRVLLAASDPADWPSEAVARAAADGYAYAAGEVEEGFHSVAVPLRRWDGRVVAALNVGTGVARRSEQSMRGEVLARLRVAAGDLQNQLV